MKQRLIAISLCCFASLLALHSVAIAQGATVQDKKAAQSADINIFIEPVIIYEIENSPSPMLGLNKEYVKSAGKEGIWETNSFQGRFSMARYPPGIEYEIDFDTSNVKCHKTDNEGRKATCSYDIKTSGMLRWLFKTRYGDYVVADLTRGPVRRTDKFVKVGNVWTSPDIRDSMLREMSNIQPTGGSGGNAQNQMCRALGAGVVASGGSSDSQKMHSAAGC